MLTCDDVVYPEIKICGINVSNEKTSKKKIADLLLSDPFNWLVSFAAIIINPIHTHTKKKNQKPKEKKWKEKRQKQMAKNKNLIRRFEHTQKKNPNTI